MFSFNKSTIIIGIFIGVFAVSGLFLINQPKKVTTHVLAANMKFFTAADLKTYDGTNPSRPIYLALDGYVYDVTSGKEYYQVGGSYHSLAGKDSSNELHLFGGEIIKRKYKVVGRLSQ